MESTTPRFLIHKNISETNLDFDEFSSTFDFSVFESFLHGSVESNLTGNVTLLLEKLQANIQKGVFELFVDYLNIYFIPVIIMVGLVGNILSALVFTCTHLCRLSSSLYLTWLSLADVGFLLALTVGWLDRVGVHWMTVAGSCQCVVYLTRVCACLSVWFVLSFTMERYIIVYHVLRKDQLCTKKKAKIVIAVVCVITMIVYLYIFPTYDVIAFGPKKICGPNPQYADMMTIMTSIDTAVACIIPSVAILILNAKIIHKLHEFQSHRLYRANAPSRTLLHRTNAISQRRSVVHASISTTGSMRIKFSKHESPEDEDSPDSQMLNTISPSNCQSMVKCRSQLRTARMLLVVSSMFVLLNLPSHVFRVQAFLHQLLWDSVKTPRSLYKLHEFFELFFFLNFAINFFLYSMCGKQFRVGLGRLTQRIKYKLWKAVTTNRSEKWIKRCDAPVIENIGMKALAIV